MKPLNIGVVGATGVVGETFIKLLETKRFPVGELRLFASDKSVGLKMPFCGQNIAVQGLNTGCFKGLDLVFFSSGDNVSLEWAPQAVREGAFAVDNSAAFRMNPRYPLVVPEVNGHLLTHIKEPTLIANPNCSTIQLVVALNPLAREFGIEDVRVASYQAVSGAGKAGREELLQQIDDHSKGKPFSDPKIFAHPIAYNCIPHIGSFNELGYCSEEMKIIHETKKILEQPQLKVSAFTVRIPALNAHSEAVWVTLKKPASRGDFISCLEKAPGLRVIRQENPADYPVALNVSGQEPVFVGRIHQDVDNVNTWLMWVVADNLLKGAALNGLQIAQQIFDIS